MSDLFRPEVLNKRVHSFLGSVQATTSKSADFLFWLLLVLVFMLCIATALIEMPLFVSTQGSIELIGPEFALFSRQDTTGVIAQVDVRPGAEVAEGEALAVVEYDKSAPRGLSAIEGRYSQEIVSPVAGMVVWVGRVGGVTQKRAELARLRPLYKRPRVQFYVPEQLIFAVQVGDVIEITLPVDRSPARSHIERARITRLVRVSDNGKGARVEAELDEKLTSIGSRWMRDAKVDVRLPLGHEPMYRILCSLATMAQER